MASISSVGIGSGVLTSELIDKLTSAERAPAEARLNAKEEEVSAKLSAYGQLRSAITDLRLPARTLGNPAALRELTFSSSNASISGTVGSSSQPGTYSLEVSKLAQAHTVSTGTFADKDTTTLGTGTLTLQAGTASVNITVDGTNNTLEGLAASINAESSIDVTASVINNGSGFQLVINSNQTGVDNALTLTVNDSDGNHLDTSGLSQLAFNGSANNLTESVIAQDATFDFNGIPITRSSNTIDDLLTGTTFELSGTNAGSPATIKIEEDSEKVADRVEEFIEKFNELKTLVTELTEYNTNDPSASGILLGDSTVRLISSQTRNLLSGVIPGLENANVRSLVDVGVSTNKDTGEILFDRSTFIDALKDHTDDVVALFSDQGRTSDSQVDFVSKTFDSQPGSYAVNITQLATHGAFSGTVDVSAGVTIDANNDTFRISVDGTESSDIVLTAGAYTSADLVTEIQAQIDADTNLKNAGAQIVVGLDGSNQLTFTSTSFGSASKVDFTSVSANSLAQLGIDAIAGTDGLDVAGTINGQTATGVGQQLSLNKEGDDANGISLSITGGTTGNRGTVTVIKGVADRFVDLFTGMIGVDGSLTSRTDGLSAQLLEIDKERSSLDLRVESLRERLVKQFTSADIRINRLNSTMDFISAQLASLSGSSDK
ncbi:flagellar capping protein [Oleiphilus messinensis]|uniref:Flagellar hook-associated protein 2 n=1 Tax=Oleiphilus messinensis TaxID=141451 RepID=A0A1Y0ICP0_9GAMM|nr:flagellar filament capping protein FliD [Oleiphilus messinensis]ARU57154.1 flagellar capping protein [Oleiphilus messinensis]